jgi:hypothetical protein
MCKEKNQDWCSSSGEVELNVWELGHLNFRMWWYEVCLIADEYLVVVCLICIAKYQCCTVLYGLFFLQVHIEFVENMLTVHNKYKELIREVFHGDQNFIAALDKACSFVVNHRPNPKVACRSPEMVGIVYSNNINLLCLKLLELNPVCLDE